MVIMAWNQTTDPQETLPRKGGAEDGIRESANFQSERGLGGGGVHERILIKIRFNLYDELIIRLEANQVV